MALTAGVTVQLALHVVLSILPLMVYSQCTDGEVRIGDTPSVEVCVNSTWSALCDNNLTLEDAAVVCRELGYSALGAQQGHLAPANGTSQGPFPECTGREAAIRECPATTTSIPEECWHVSVACQPVGDVRTLEVCFAANDSEVSNPISAAELLASEIALSLYHGCACAYSTTDVYTSFERYSEGMLVFRARISYTEPLNESVAALQRSAPSTDPTSIDVNGVPFTPLQECPGDFVAPSAMSVTPTLVLAKYSGLSVVPHTSSTPLALGVASSSYSVTVPPNTAVQPSSTPATSGPTSSKPLPVAALAAGVCGGVLLLILTGLCLGAAVVSVKMTKGKKDIPTSQKPKQRQAHSYEEVDNESIMDPDHIFLNSVYEGDNISIATRTTQLTTDAIYASVDGALTQQFLSQESLEHPYATLNPYPEPSTYSDTETINPYRVSEILMDDRTAPQFQEVINPYAEPEADNRGSDTETGTQDSKVSPYRVSVIVLEDRTAPEVQSTNNPYAEPDVGTSGSDTETGTPAPTINPYRVSRVLLEDKTCPQGQEGTNHKQYSSLDRDAQYATLEPFRGGLSKALESSEDGYSRLKHIYPTTGNTEPIPDPLLTIMETPV